MKSKALIFISMVNIALGVVFTTLLKQNGSLGIVFIAVGGLLFILGMAKRKREENNH